MTPSVVLNKDKAHRIAAMNVTPRFLELDRFERYVQGTQYEGKPHFLNQKLNVPVLERAPCIVYPLVQCAIRSNVDLCIGEGRFPTVTSFLSEDDREFDPNYGLSDDDSYVLDKGIVKICEQTRLKMVLRSLLETAQSCKTAVALCGVKNGKLFVEYVHAKWCTPTFDPSTNEVLSLEIKYPYIKIQWNEVEKRYEAICKMYRRVIDALKDTTFKPADAHEDGSEPFWIVDTQVEHNLGFCPVVWYPFLKECSVISDVDGQAIHQHLLDEIDALNFSLSQFYRASLYGGDPQLYEIGVAPNEIATAPGHYANEALFGTSSNSTYAIQSSGYVSGAATPLEATQRRGVTNTLQYPNPDAKVGFLTLPGDALQAIRDHASDLRSKICEALHVLWIDPDTAKLASDLSGKALELLYKRQTSRCDQIRSDFGDKCILPLIQMLLRIAYRVHSQNPGSLYLPGIDKISPIMARFEQQAVIKDGTVNTQWVCPHLDLIWPPYFTPTDADALQVAQTLTAILPLGLITKEMALQKLKAFFPFESAEDVLESVNEEKQEAQQKAVEFMQTQGKNLSSDPTSNAEPDEPPPSSTNEPEVN